MDSEAMFDVLLLPRPHLIYHPVVSSIHGLYMFAMLTTRIALTTEDSVAARALLMAMSKIKNKG
jgi:hypothetical protein